MNASLENRILMAKDLTRAGAADVAAQLADELIAAHPEEMTVWLLRVYLNERDRNHAAATADLTRVS